MFGKIISLDENILRKNRIPLLTDEPEWVRLFGSVNNRQIQSAKDNLIQAIKEEKELEAHGKEIQKKKSNHMKMILEVSNALNNEDNKDKERNIKLLDRYKDEILKINEEVDEIKYRLESFPKEIREANFQLLSASVQYGYEELKHKEKEFNKAVEELDSLRIKLREALKNKHDNEEWINATYSFLHGILGSEVIDKLDREKLK